MIEECGDKFKEEINGVCVEKNQGMGVLHSRGEDAEQKYSVPLQRRTMYFIKLSSVNQTEEIRQTMFEFLVNK